MARIQVYRQRRHKEICLVDRNHHRKGTHLQHSNGGLHCVDSVFQGESGIGPDELLQVNYPYRDGYAQGGVESSKAKITVHEGNSSWPFKVRRERGCGWLTGRRTKRDLPFDILEGEIGLVVMSCGSVVLESCYYAVVDL
jgi:hypothetical protein